MLCGVYVGATRLVHSHHEKIAARPCKESHTAEDVRKHVFRDFFISESMYRKTAKRTNRQFFELFLMK